MFNRMMFVLIALSVVILTSDHSIAPAFLPTQTLDLSVNPPIDAAKFQFKSKNGAIFRPDFKTWSLADVSGKEGITFNLTLLAKMPVVLKMNVAAAIVQGKPDCGFSITANDTVVAENYADTNDHFHPVQFEIDSSVLKKGDNTITVALEDFATTQLFINAVTVSSFAEPQNLVSVDGKLEVPLYVQFGITSITGAVNSKGQPVNDTDIWARAYGINRPEDDPRNKGQWMPSLELVPGPSFVYKPDDLFQVFVENQLNKKKNERLAKFAGPKSITDTNPDDIPVHVTHEINIPHDGDNTNLHVHGLHVDPRRDNVLLLIVPEDDKPRTYSESLQKDIPSLKPNPGANGKYWTWRYSYKIPPDHMPGTHWYHAHKHGATATQVENGMAGAMVIRPKDESNTFAPGLWSNDLYKTHDRVMVLQEIANYGVQQGTGISADVKDVQPGSQNAPGQAPDITVNGLHQPTLQLVPGQIERWRFVNAGANHRTSNYMWLGKKTKEKDSWDVPVYENAVPEGNNADNRDTPQMYLVAVDGITFNKPVKITAANPAVVAAGNRSDFLVRIPDDGEYAIFKNFPVNPIKGSKNTKGELNKQTSFGGVAAIQTTPKKVTGLQPPSNLTQDPFDLGVDYVGFTKPWPKTVNQSGILEGDVDLNTPIVPLLTAQANGNLVQINIKPKDTTKLEGVGLQPIKHQGGGSIDNQLLAFVNTSKKVGTAENGSIPHRSMVNLSPFSPTGSAKNLTYIDKGQPKVGRAPGYAAPIADKQINIPPVSMVFDLSGANFLYETNKKDKKGNKVESKIQQFSLNGRQFNLEDYVGNPDAQNLIQTHIRRNAYATENDEKENKPPFGQYNYAGINLWTNEIAALDSKAYWTNPSYYVPIIEKTAKDDGTQYYTYDYSNKGLKLPTYKQVTGLDAPSQPMAQSAQEWILINNSSIFHPFHIHISPFFVTEVGQLNYDTKNGRTTHYIYAPPRDSEGNPLSSEPQRQPFETPVKSRVQYVVGNWWDVLMIPPHGYVKFRTWINVPKQTPGPDDTNATQYTVKENTNSVAQWVFHCHILRHEDRGMMMIVQTKENPNPKQ